MSDPDIKAVQLSTSIFLSLLKMTGRTVETTNQLSRHLITIPLISLLAWNQVSTGNLVKSVCLVYRLQHRLAIAMLLFAFFLVSSSAIISFPPRGPCTASSVFLLPTLLEPEDVYPLYHSRLVWLYPVVLGFMFASSLLSVLQSCTSPLPPLYLSSHFSRSHSLATASKRFGTAFTYLSALLSFLMFVSSYVLCVCGISL